MDRHATRGSRRRSWRASWRSCLGAVRREAEGKAKPSPTTSASLARPPRAVLPAQLGRRHRGREAGLVGLHAAVRLPRRRPGPGRRADRPHGEPYLIDESDRTALAVPAMENIGELRQVAPLEQNRTYFMIFGNPGGLVKPGGRVTLVVGNFRAEGLVVE